MFSGTIDSLGTISRLRQQDRSVTPDVATGFEGLVLGESVAINGTCLTAVTFDSAVLAQFYASTETLVRTNFAYLCVGNRVNRERTASFSTRLSGHIVQGHVDRHTGASERTIKYWLSGERGPSGEYLILLAQHYDVVLMTALTMAEGL